MSKIPESMMDEAAKVLGTWLIENGHAQLSETISIDKVADNIVVRTSGGLEVQFTEQELRSSHKPLPDLIAEKLKACSPKP